MSANLDALNNDLRVQTTLLEQKNNQLKSAVSSGRKYNLNKDIKCIRATINGLQTRLHALAPVPVSAAVISVAAHLNALPAPDLVAPVAAHSNAVSAPDIIPVPSAPDLVAPVAAHSNAVPAPDLIPAPSAPDLVAPVAAHSNAVPAPDVIPAPVSFSLIQPSSNARDRQNARTISASRMNLQSLPLQSNHTSFNWKIILGIAAVAGIVICVRSSAANGMTPIFPVPFPSDYARSLPGFRFNPVSRIFRNVNGITWVK